MPERHQHILFFVLLSVIALGAMATLYVSTTAGLGFGNDSVAYVGAARNILDGNGYARTSGGGEIKPITHYPPLFSLTLASGSALIGYDPLRVARALIIFLWGLGAFLGGWLVWRMSRSRVAWLVFAFLFAANGPLLFVYAIIMSEPLYIALTFGAFLLLSFYFEKQKRVFLVAAGLLAGLAYLTRYSGLALLATIAAMLFLVESGWKQKFRSVLVFIAAALPFILAWTLYNSLRGLSGTNRVFSYHPIAFEKIDFGVREVWDWLIPGWFVDFTSSWPVLSILRASGDWPGTPYLVIGLLGLVLFIWVVLVMKRLWVSEAQNPPLATFFTSTLYLFVYLAAIVFSLLFFDASTPFRDRILAPIFISLLTVFVVLGAWFFRKATLVDPGPSARRTVLQGLVIILALSVASVSLADVARTVTRLQNDPLGYASARWRNSKTVAAIKALPADTIIYSNSPTGTYILADRPAYIMPTPIDPVDNQPRGSFDEDVAQLRADLLAGKAVLVVFRPGLENPALLALLTDGIPLYFKAGDGQIFGRP